MHADRRGWGSSRFDHFTIDWRFIDATVSHGPSIEGRLLLYGHPQMTYLLTLAEPRQEFRLVSPNAWEAVGRIELHLAPGARPRLFGDFAYGYQGHQEVFRGDVTEARWVERPVPVGEVTEIEMLDIEPVELLRFTALRPPGGADSDAGKRFVTWSAAASSSLVTSLLAARSQPDAHGAMQKLAKAFAAGSDFVADLGQLAAPLVGLGSLVRGLLTFDPAGGPSALGALASQCGLDVSALQGPAPAYEAQLARLWESLLALLIAGPLAASAGSPSDGAAALVAGLVTCRLLERLAAEDPALNTAAGMREALQATVALPGSVLPLPPAPGQPSAYLTESPPPLPPAGSTDGTSGWVRILGIGDLEIVKHRVLRYALGEIAHINNIMRGELRRNLRTQTERTSSSLSETSTRAVGSDQGLREGSLSDDLQREIAAATLSHTQTYTSSSASNPITRSYSVDSEVVSGQLSIDRTDTCPAQTRSTLRYARDILLTSARRLKERWERRSLAETMRETHESELRAFDNRGGARNLVGVYRWVCKICEARVHNQGWRLILEFYLPDPSAPLRASEAARQLVPSGVLSPAELSPPIRSFEDITPQNYAQVAALYEVYDLPPPPPPLRTVTAVLNGPAGESATGLPLPDGYRASTASINVRFAGSQVVALIGQAQATIPQSPPSSGSGTTGSNGTSASGILTVPATGSGGTGGTTPPLQWQTGLATVSLSGEDGMLSAALSADGQPFEANIEVSCTLGPERMSAWQILVYGRILTAYNEQRRVYTASLRERGEAVLAAERTLIRSTLEQGAMALLGSLIGPVPAAAEINGALLLREAFVWDEMTYFVWPPGLDLTVPAPAGAPWQRHERGIRQRVGPDPSLTVFMCAKAAVVNVAVRPEALAAVLFLLSFSGIAPEQAAARVTLDSLIPLWEEMRRLGPLRSEPRHHPGWRLVLPTGMVALDERRAPWLGESGPVRIAPNEDRLVEEDP